MKFIEELKRRNVIKATIAYLVVAWVLIQVLTNILPIFEAPAWVLKTLMILFAAGLPVWVLFSWIYEVTPEGLKKTDQVSTDISITSTTNKRLNIIIVFMLIIAIGTNFLKSGDRPVSEQVAAVEPGYENTIAVMPFLDMSPNKDQEYYSDGIAVEILNSLCKFKELRVVARTSSFSFKNSNEDIRTIGSKLNANHILEGSVQKQGNKILISVRLLNALDGYTLFSESYVDEIENVFLMQSRIAHDIAEKISSKLVLRNELLPPKKINPRSYELFLKGKLQFISGPLNMKPEEVFRAKKYFENALELDPEFAEASAYLSLVYFNLADWALSGRNGINRTVALDSAKLLAIKAHDLDSMSSGAHLAMGSYYFHEYNWIQAEREKRKAVTLNPGGGEEKFNLASFLAQFGHTEEALALDREALKLDPLDDRAQIKYIRDLYYAKKWEEAIKRCEALISENRALNGAYQFMYISYADMGQLEKAGDALSKLMELTNQDQIAFIFGNNDFKTAVLKMFEHDASAHFQLLRNPMHRAVFYAYIEDRENTLKYLNESYNNREPLISFIRGARFDFIREDPRFEALYRMAGFKTYDDYQLDKGRFSASL